MCDTRRAHSRDFRRRGSVLILVTALLGMLFVMGVAFMASMNFEAEMIAAERHQSGVEDGIDGMFDEVGGLLKEGMPFEAVQFLGSSPTYAELPGYHNTFSPIEPSYRLNGAVLFDWLTDVESLRDEPFTGSQFMGMTLDTSLRSGSLDVAVLGRVVVDADGDGVVDSVQFDVADALDFSAEQLVDLSELLNPFSETTGEVYLGLRIIPHGGMVNLNESHPSLIDNVLDRDGGYVHSPLQRGVFYSPVLEEHLLRRRCLLPPRIIPPSALHGNMFLDDDPDSTGDGDMPFQLFPPGETVFERDHRYWPFLFDEMYMPEDPDAFVSLWSVRMEPETSFGQEPSGEEYDRRHLVTTVSYDDLLARSAQVTVLLTQTPPPDDTTEADIRDKMIEANRDYADPECAFLPFEYVDYPQDIPNEGDCDCPSDPGCRFDPRKGRLLLSLPWVQDAVQEGVISSSSAVQLIQDAFMVMLFNAAGPMWEDDCHSSGCLATGEVCVSDPGTGANICVDPQLNNQPHRLAQIARTAASLTANLIDFMDADGVPTRVEVRSCDFNDISTAGRGFNPPVYVYGLERQPFITELAIDRGRIKDAPIYYAVELFNPYSTELEISPSSYYVKLGSAGGWVAFPESTIRIPAKGYLVLRNETDAFQGSIGADAVVTEVPGLELINPKTLFLLREVEYIDPLTGDAQVAKIVVDQFDVSDTNFQPTQPTAAPYVFSIERPSVSASSPWRAPLPADASFAQAGTHSLGADNIQTDPARRPVEVFFADTGDMRTAFPTTGSLLLLMRYANRSWDDFSNYSITDLAFTTELGGLDRSVYYDAAAGGEASDMRDRFELIDNGHMPVFEKDGVYAHRKDPALESGVNDLGGIAALPWGQLVFDYFTALPLSSGGPYRGDPDSLADPDSIPRVDLDGLRVHGRININAAPWRVLAGLPLMPVEVFQEYPAEVRDKISRYAGLVSGDAVPIGDQRARAIVAYREMRELSDGLDAAGELMITGDYGVAGSYGRNWGDPDPAARRGTGFMTVGELLNVRHPDAYREAIQPIVGYDDYSLYRMDAGVVGSADDTSNPPPSTEDYVSAVSLMVALGDWVTVRSQVFTIYGVLRGQEDQAIVDSDPQLQEVLRIQDIDSRAIRFQETVDRLPTFLGERLPVHIGERVITGYSDAQND